MRHDFKLPAAFAGGIAVAWLAIGLIGWLSAIRWLAARLFDRAQRSRSLQSA
jgi:hypothetical protein